MGIKYKCPKCDKEIELPDTPNFETSKWEQLVHNIYTSVANNKRPCFECERKK